jgi:hypothetical protein
MEASDEENFLFRRIGIFPTYRLVQQLFLKDRRSKCADADALGIFRQ